MFNEIILIGRVAKKPVFKQTANGVKLSMLVLEVERPYRNNLGIKEKDYISCVLWRGISNQVMDCCDVGSILGIKGRLQSKTFETAENQTSTITEVKVEHVEFLDRIFLEQENYFKK